MVLRLKPLLPKFHPHSRTPPSVYHSVRPLLISPALTAQHPPSTISPTPTHDHHPPPSLLLGKVRKERAPKEKKKKAPKDMTKDRTLESLFEELVNQVCSFYFSFHMFHYVYTVSKVFSICGFCLTVRQSVHLVIILYQRRLCLHTMSFALIHPLHSPVHRPFPVHSSVPFVGPSCASVCHVRQAIRLSFLSSIGSEST